ncbi:UNVERIFIED_CONTAM: hypothetical protein O8I53_09670 [Campylobacter lari]
MLKTFIYKDLEVSYFTSNIGADENLILIPNLFRKYIDYSLILNNYALKYNIYSLNINLLYLNRNTKERFAQTS